MKLSSHLVYLMALAGHLAMAQTDPPSRVARLSHLEGSVSFQAGTVEEWVPAVINRPLTTGDGLWADDGSRAELEIGTATMRLSRQTGISFLNLDDSTTQIQLDRGTLQISLQQLGDGETFEVDTPNVAFSLSRAGEYRFEVSEQGDLSAITVRVGAGEASFGDQTIAVSAPSRARFSGTGSVSYVLGTPPPLDDFDAWCNSRQRREERSESVRYVSPGMVGYQDLDQHGSWRTDPEYGPVWTPRVVAADWAPYRYGRWVWVDPWGWTWIDDAPWGFAPFHYGRWRFFSGVWGWVPGPVVVRPVYAPALVVWVGGTALGAGAAWFPLGPREPYVPVYRTSPTYIRRVNITTVNITNINVTRVHYANRTYVTAVSRETFVTAGPVARSMVQVHPSAIARARVTNIVQVPPQRASVLGYGGLPARVAHPPAPFTRPVVARATPPPPRVPFSQQERLLAKTRGRPLDSSEIARLRPAAARHPNVRPVTSRPSGQVTPSEQPGKIRARSPGSGPTRPAASSREASADERRLRQEQQQRQRVQREEQKKQQRTQPAKQQKKKTPEQQKNQ
jgi:hypothetical protein